MVGVANESVLFVPHFFLHVSRLNFVSYYLLDDIINTWFKYCLFSNDSQIYISYLFFLWALDL